MDTAIDRPVGHPITCWPPHVSSLSLVHILPKLDMHIVLILEKMMVQKYLEKISDSVRKK